MRKKEENPMGEEPHPIPLEPCYIKSTWIDDDSLFDFT
jgi:hypothetical protein